MESRISIRGVLSGLFFQGAVEAEGGVVCYRCGVEVRVYDKTEPRSSLSNGGGGVGGGGGGGGGWG